MYFVKALCRVSKLDNSGIFLGSIHVVCLEELLVDHILIHCSMIRIIWYFLFALFGLSLTNALFGE